jgi:hypothetical protein
VLSRRLPIEVLAAVAVAVGMGGSGQPAESAQTRLAVDGPRLALCSVPPASPAGAGRSLAAFRAGPTLPPGTLHGLAHRLQQYPAVALATAAQRRAAQRLLDESRRAARAWRDPRRAVAAGFAAERPRRRPGDRRIGFLHAEHRRLSADRTFLDPTRPEVLIYVNAPGRPLVLVGVMFSVPRGVRGATPGGPVTRWHSHLVCARGDERGLKPRPDGSCPPGSRLRRGSEMMHLWFTRDLRSAFAIHAPVHELCIAGLVPPAHCRHDQHSHG